MQTIVTENYPAERLPAEVRAHVDPKARVRVTVDVVSPSPDLQKPRLKLTDFIGAAPGVYGDEDPVDPIRALRDEWD